MRRIVVVSIVCMVFAALFGCGRSQERDTSQAVAELATEWERISDEVLTINDSLNTITGYMRNTLRRLDRDSVLISPMDSAFIRHIDSLALLIRYESEKIEEISYGFDEFVRDWETHSALLDDLQRRKEVGRKADINVPERLEVLENKKEESREVVADMKGALEEASINLRENYAAYLAVFDKGNKDFRRPGTFTDL
jgi:hypothetical protein